MFSATIVSFLGGFFAFLAYKISTLGSEIPDGIPWVGQDHQGPFKRTRSYLRSVFYTREMIREGYEKVFPLNTTQVRGIDQKLKSSSIRRMTGLLSFRTSLLAPKYSFRLLKLIGMAMTFSTDGNGMELTLIHEKAQ